MEEGGTVSAAMCDPLPLGTGLQQLTTPLWPGKEIYRRRADAWKHSLRIKSGAACHDWASLTAENGAISVLTRSALHMAPPFFWATATTVKCVTV